MDITPGTEVVVRRRHLHDKATGRLEEIGAGYIPVDIAGGSYLEQPTVVPKVLFAQDGWVSRLPTSQETVCSTSRPSTPSTADEV
jgi:GntR family transcriptional regulator